MISTSDLFKHFFQDKESKGTIISDTEEAIEAAKTAISLHRSRLENYVETHPGFLHSLKPITVDEGPEVVRLMAEAADCAGVGPMAAVAGVLADLAVEEMVLEGAIVAIVENGGEAFLVSDRPMDVAFSAGDSPLSKRMAFRLEDFPVGVATSSGLYSHALSFGESEAVTIFARNAGLADAAATAVGNIVKGDDVMDSIERGVERALSIEGVRGAFIAHRGMVGMGGEVPRFVGVNVNDSGNVDG